MSEWEIIDFMKKKRETEPDKWLSISEVKRELKEKEVCNSTLDNVGIVLNKFVQFSTIEAKMIYKFNDWNKKFRYKK